MAAGDAFQELKRRAERAGMSEEAYLDEMLEYDPHQEVLRSPEYWEEVLAPALEDEKEGRTSPLSQVKERMVEYRKGKRP